MTAISGSVSALGFVPTAHPRGRDDAGLEEWRQLESDKVDA